MLVQGRPSIDMPMDLSCIVSCLGCHSVLMFAGPDALSAIGCGYPLRMPEPVRSIRQEHPCHRLPRRAKCR